MWPMSNYLSNYTNWFSIGIFSVTLHNSLWDTITITEVEEFQCKSQIIFYIESKAFLFIFCNELHMSTY